MGRRRPRFGLIHTLVIVALLSLAPAGPGQAQFEDLLKPASPVEVEPTISPLEPGDERKSETQRARVAELARRRLGLTLGRRTSTDLDALQRLLDERVVGPRDTWDQQALGVVLGDALVRDQGTLSWVVVDDRFGHSRALRWRDSLHVFYPVTMISKRIELGDSVEVRGLYEQVVQAVAKLEAERASELRRQRGRR